MPVCVRPSGDDISAILENAAMALSAIQALKSRGGLPVWGSIK